MFRTARIISPLIRSLLLGVVGVSAVGATAVMTAGCEDKDQPEYYVKRLDTPQRAQAVKRLQLFFQDAMVRANDKRDDPKVKALLDKIVPPLTAAYVKGDSIGDHTKTVMIQLLFDTRDKRAKAAWVKALKDYKPNVGEARAKYAAKAIAETGIKDPDAMSAMIQMFVKFQAGSKKGSLTYLDIKKAMLKVSSPSWKPQLIERMGHKITIPNRKKQPTEDEIRTYRNELFWQTISAEILGNIKATDAIKPLFETVVNPSKADVAATSIVAMVKMGKASTQYLTDVVLGKDKDITAFAAKVIKNKKDAASAPLRSAVLVLGTIGRSDALKPLLFALEKTAKNDKVTKALIARELSKCPPTPESFKAFMDVLDNTSVAVTIPPGATAVEVLLESLARFYDASVIDGVMQHADKYKGDSQDRDILRDATMITMIKLMRKQDADKVGKKIESWNPKKNQAKLEKSAFKKSKKLLDACGDKVECYIAKIQEASIQNKKEQFIGIKAAYMIGMFGNDGHRMQIVKALPKIKNAAIKFAVGQALDHLTPKGDKKVADALGKLIDTDLKKGDRNRILGNQPLRQIRYRIIARSE